VEKEVSQNDVPASSERRVHAQPTPSLKHPGVIGVESSAKCKSSLEVRLNVADRCAARPDQTERRLTSLVLGVSSFRCGHYRARLKLELILPARRNHVRRDQLMKRDLKLLGKRRGTGHAELY